MPAGHTALGFRIWDLGFIPAACQATALDDEMRAKALGSHDDPKFMDEIRMELARKQQEYTV